MDLNPPFTLMPSIKAMINLGALLDIPTGRYLPGKHGEMVLNGGLGNLTGVVGKGNNFKTTLMRFMTFIAMLRVSAETRGTLYDTEINTHEVGVRRLYENLPDFEGEDWLETGKFQITDRSMHTADEWYDILRTWLMEKRKATKFLRDTPFIDNEGELIKILVPTFTEIDSFSEFITANAMKLQDENNIGESGTNMLNMQQGRAKSQFLMDIPPLAQAAYNYVLMTAHVGDEFSMDPRKPPEKKLTHMKQGQKIKGAPEKFTFVMNNCWHCHSASPLMNDTTKGPEYPRDSDDNMKGDTDLNSVQIKQLRGKSGASGMTLEIIVSQTEGVLPALTEFHYLKGVKIDRKEKDKRFGISGNIQNYELDLLPGVALSRTTVRGKIDTMPELRRALNISAEMAQMHQLWHDLPEGLLCTPKELYDDLKAKGYDWAVLLATRGWWTLNNEDHPIPFLSTMDLLRMRTGEYHPYWHPALK